MQAPPAAGTVTMYSTTWCGYCRRLKSQMDREGIAYTEVNIEEGYVLLTPPAGLFEINEDSAEDPETKGLDSAEEEPEPEATA